MRPSSELGLDGQGLRLRLEVGPWFESMIFWA